MEGNYPAAIKQYDEAIRRDPTNASFYNNRGTAFSKLMDYGRALDDIQKALELDPQYVKAYMRPRQHRVRAEAIPPRQAQLRAWSGDRREGRGLPGGSGEDGAEDL